MYLAILVAFVCLLYFAPIVRAVTVTISNIPSSISDQPFNIDVSISEAQLGSNYLRANFFPTGTNNYFGYTYNGSSFVNNSDYSQYYPISIGPNGSWSGSLQLKLDTSSNFYNGPGDYSLKVRRYTQSGSSYTWSNETNLTVVLPTATSSPSTPPSQTPTLSPIPTSSSSFNISNTPSQLNLDQSFKVYIALEIPNSPNSVYYLKGAFKKSGGSNYFGLTKNGSWIKNNSKYSSQYKIITDSSGKWLGDIEVQPDGSDSGFEGSGDYLFKVARYDNDGNGPFWSNEVTISIAQNTNPTQFQIINTPTLKSSQSPTKLLSAAKNSSTSSKSETLGTDEASLLNYESPKLKESEEIKTQSLWLPTIGGFLILTGVGSIIYIYNKHRIKSSE